MTQAKAKETTVADITLLDNELHHLLSSARDALTDETVTRLSDMLGSSIDLLDKINRSGIEQALPSITRLVENGDLDRIVNLMRVVGAAADSLNEEMIARLALIVTEMVSLTDRLSRNDGFMRLIIMLEREDLQTCLLALIESLHDAGDEMPTRAPQGGFRNLWRLVTQAETQEAFRFLVSFSKNLKLR